MCFAGEDEGWRDLLLPPAVAGDSGTGWWAVALDGAEPGGDDGAPLFDDPFGDGLGGPGGGRAALPSRGTDTVSLDIAAIEDESFRSVQDESVSPLAHAISPIIPISVTPFPP